MSIADDQRTTAGQEPSDLFKSNLMPFVEHLVGEEDLDRKLFEPVLRVTMAAASTSTDDKVANGPIALDNRIR